MEVWFLETGRTGRTGRTLLQDREVRALGTVLTELEAPWQTSLVHMSDRNLLNMSLILELVTSYNRKLKKKEKNHS